MRKADEEYYAGSCWNKAEPDEIVFVLLGRDPAYQAAVKAWAAERIRLGLNKANDRKILEALATADALQRSAVIGTKGIAGRMSPEAEGSQGA